MAVVRHCGRTDDHSAHPFTGIDRKKCKCPGGAKPLKNIVPPEKKPLKPESRRGKPLKPASGAKAPTKCTLTFPHPAHKFGGVNCPGVKPKRKPQ